MKSYKKALKKGLSFALTFNLLLQSFVPFALSPVYAADSTSSAETIVASPTPEVTPEVTPTPAETPTPTPTEEITPTPTEVITPTHTPDPTPEITPEATPSPTIEVTPTIEPTLTPAPDVTQEPSSNTDSQAPPQENNQTSSDTPSEPTPTPTPSVPESLTIASNLEQTLTAQPTLTTDKTDYFPTDTAYISGTGFLANTIYTLHIQSSDSPMVSYKVDLTTDENGSLSYVYQLDGHYRPDYTIDALDSSNKIVSTYSFTDSGPTANVSTFAELNTALADVSVSTINITADITGISSSIQINRGITIEGNGFTFYPTFTKTDNSNNATFNITSSNVTLKNLTVDGTSGTTLHGINVYVSTNVLLDTVSVINNDRGGIIVNGSVVTVKDIHTSGNGWYGIDVDQGSGVTTEARLIITGASSHGDTTHIYVDDNRKGSVTDTDPNQYTVTNNVHARTYTLIAIPTATITIPWPTTWNTPNSCVSDPVNDESPSSSDLIGVPGTPAVGFNSDSNYQYFRERVDGNPAGAGGYDQFAWVTIFQTTGTQYQYLSSVNGVAEKVQLYQNTSPAGDVDFNPLFNDPAETLLWQGDSYNYARITTGSDGKKYVEWAIPLTELTSRGITSSTTKFFATSANANNYNKDHLQCYEAFADLSVVKTDSPDPVVNGGTLTYTLAIHNAGPDSASGVVVTDTLPSGYVVTSVTPSQGSCSDMTAPSISCELGTLANGGDASVTIIGTITTSLSSITNTASVNLDTTASIDLNLANNTDSEDTSINPSTGTVVVHKDVVDPDGNATTDSTIFKILLDDANSQDISDGNTVTYLNVITGLHTIKEDTLPDGYTLGSITSGGNITVHTGTNDIYIVNKQSVAALTVTKIVQDPQGNVITTDATHFTANVGSASQEIYQGHNALFNLNPGTYSVSESENTDYEQLGCRLPSGADATDFTLGAGEPLTVTCTNRQKLAKITVVKDVVKSDLSPVNDDHGFSVTLNSLLKPFSESTVAEYLVNPGTYSAIESNDDNYTLVSNSGSVTVGSKGSATIDIVNKQNPGTISGYKFNADGSTPISGWTINLLNCSTDFTSCVSLNTDSTDVNGYYSFANLVTGTYQVMEVLQDGWTNLTSLFHNVTVTPGAVLGQNNFTNFEKISISGQKYNDQNGNGAKDSGETGLSGWTIQLLNTNSVVLASAITDVNGNYSFSNLANGSYKVREVLQPGWAQTSTNPSDITAVSGTNVTGIDFGNQMRGSIKIIKDAKPNSAQNFSFTGTLGSFSLDDDANATLPNNRTFSDLGSNTYTITEGEITGWKLTDLVCTGDDNSQIDINGRTVTISLDHPGENVTCTFTNTKYGSIQGRKYNDLNKDGTLDTGEPYLDGWTIKLFDNEMNELSSVVTGAGSLQQGQYKFIDLLPGTYNLCEVPQTNWRQTDPSTGADYQGTHCRQRTLTAGQSLTGVHFGNTRNTGTIVVNKIIDVDGDLNTTEDQTLGSNWQFDVDGTGQDTTDAPATYTNTLGTATFNDLKTGEYTIVETTKPGYKLFTATCGTGNGTFDNTDSIDRVTVSKDGTTTCNFYNKPTGTIHGYKWDDANGDGQPWEENKLSGWTIELYKSNGEGYDKVDTMDTDSGNIHFGWYWFENLFPGQYKVCEVQKDGWTQTYPINSKTSNCHTMTLPDGNSNGFEEQLNAVSGPVYKFGNRLADPAITISRSNNAGAPLTPGSSFEQTITIKVTGNNISNLKLTDLLPQGVTFSGIYSVVKNDTDPVTLAHVPEYHSPGVWELGDFAEGDVITVKYTANVSPDIKPGTYTDLAWAIGDNPYEEGQQDIYATGENSEYVSEIFVGTDVEVVKDQTSGGTYDVEKKVEGQVLGASTDLPATGANELWLIVALISLYFGIKLVRSNKAK